MPNKKFTREFLHNLCCKYNITLLRNYDEKELNCQKFIDFKCIKCNENTSKQFAYMEKYSPTCHSCSDYEGRKTAKNIILLKYGVENISQSEEIKNKKKETTLKNYGVEHNSQSAIIKNKKIETSLKNNGVEYPQQSQEVRNKSKQTCLQNYGVEHPMQCESIKEEMKEKNLKNHGVEFVSQSEEFKNRVKNTCLKKYGVEYPQQSQEIRNKSNQTCLKNYGVEHPAQCKEIQEKMKATSKTKYGVENYSQTDEFKEKFKQTCLNNYGVEHPNQNEKIMEIVSKKCYKQKTYVYPSGKEIQCQGYEPFALDEIIQTINEDDIITGCKNVPTIWYYDTNGKEHRHYVDIFIPNQNKCIEIKSTWTLKKTKSNIFEKQEAGKKLGYEYEIWVYNAKGDKVETYK